jgi:flagellar FliL protein
MAEDKKKKKDDEQSSGKRGKKLFLIAGLVALVVILGGGAAAFFVLGIGAGGAADASTQSQTKKDTKTYLVNMDTFVVNLSDPKGDRFMKVTLRVLVNDASLPSRIVNDDVFRTRCRDRIISVLSAKRFQDVNNPLGKEALRRELKRELGKIFPAGSIEEILFVEFIVQ